MLRHIAFIPDGNRRWARANNTSLDRAYEVGVGKIREIVRFFAKTGLAKYLTFYILSTENIMRRSHAELKILFNLLAREIRRVREDPEVHEYRIKICIIGVREVLPEDLRREIELTEETTSKYDNCVVNLAIAYGGVIEPFHMLIRKISSSDPMIVLQKLLQYGNGALREFTYFGSEVPPPDIVIRTGYEIRISNFLIPHIVSKKLVFLSKYWPDITIDDILAAIRQVEREVDVTSLRRV